MEHRCEECKKEFSNLSNLKKHVKILHSAKVEYLESLRVRKIDTYEFFCEQCGKRFMHLANLCKHVGTHGDVFVGKPSETTNIPTKCALCEYNSDKKDILKHYSVVHNIVIKENKLVFDSIAEFYSWKNNIEHGTSSKFIQESSKIRKQHEYKSFICNRSGTYLSKGSGLRNLKIQGSCKMGGYCPAKIKIMQRINGKCEAYFTETHVGHHTEVTHLKPASSSLETKRVQVTTDLTELLQKVAEMNFDELNVVQKAISSINPTIENVKSSRHFCPTVHRTPQNKKSGVTKKKRQKKTSVGRPNKEENAVNCPTP